MKTTRLVTKHCKGCYAVELVREGSWTTPWCLGEHVFASEAGSLKSGHTTSWLRFRCNSTNACPAILLIREDAVLEKFQP